MDHIARLIELQSQFCVNIYSRSREKYNRRFADKKDKCQRIRIILSNKSDDERQEMEYRARRDARWAPTVTDLIPPLIPQTIRDGPRKVRERTEILEVYSETEFRQMFRFHKEPFLHICKMLIGLLSNRLIQS